MAVDSARAKSLLLAASDLADGAAWATDQDGACGDDAPLRQRVEVLLAAHDGGDAIGMSDPASPATPGTIPAADAKMRLASELITTEHRTDDADSTVAGASRADRPAGFVAAQVIAGRYALIDVLGEGGTGTVDRADQTAPVKRQVALKLIRIGMDSRQVLARFDAERIAPVNPSPMPQPGPARSPDGFRRAVLEGKIIAVTDRRPSPKDNAWPLPDTDERKRTRIGMGDRPCVASSAIANLGTRPGVLNPCSSSAHAISTIDFDSASSP